MTLLERAIPDPVIAAAMAQVPWPDDIDYYGGLATWVITLLGKPLSPRIRLATTLAASDQPQVSISAGPVDDAHARDMGADPTARAAGTAVPGRPRP